MSETNEDITPQSREIDHTFYRKEPKRVISFNLLTFFHADINQSEVEDSFELASHWNVNKTKAVTPLAPYCNVLWRWEQVRALPPPHTNDCGTIGSLRNDGNENGKKSSRFRQAKQQLCTCITLFCTFLCRRCTTTT